VQLETLVEETVLAIDSPAGPSRPWWRTRAAYRFAALSLIVATLAVIAIVVHPSRDSMAHAFGARDNAFAPFVAVGGAALLTTAMFPRTLLAGVGGLLFGWFSGAGYILLGITIGAVAAYGVGRLLGREFMARHLKGRMLHVEQAVANRGILAVVISRMVPIVPFAISNYVFGTTSVRFLPFVAGTMLGALPATIAYAALGSATAHHNTTGMTIAGAVVLTLGAAGSLGTLLMWRKRPRKAVAAPQ
jgi:uncharacterized membrane protein YdjX (TVP38/TMEM64 family)